MVAKALIVGGFFKPIPDLTVDTAGSEGMLFNRKPLQNTCYVLQLVLAVVSLKTALGSVRGGTGEMTLDLCPGRVLTRRQRDSFPCELNFRVPSECS